MRLDFSNSQQLTAFLLSIVLGVAFSLLYSLVRFSHITFKPSKTAVFIIDIFYFFVIGVLSFCFLLIYCKGLIRMYVFLGQIIGFVISHFSLSKVFLFLLLLVKKCVDYIFNAIKKPLKIIHKKLNKNVIIPTLEKLNLTFKKLKTKKLQKNNKKYKKSSKKP